MFRLNQGLEVVDVLENYLVDMETDGWSTLIVWKHSDVSGN